MVLELLPHQQTAIDELHNGAILRGGVGSGKTRTALVYFYTKECGGVVGDLSSMRTPKDLVVITTAKKRDSLDWEEDAAALAISHDRDKSVSGIQMTVDSWNNIDKYKDVRDAFFIFDEQRLVGAGAWTKAFVTIAQHNRWILLSATPGDTWMDYVPVFIANGFFKNRTEFKRKHVVYNTFAKFPKVDHYVGTGYLARLRNQVLVEMPYLRHTTRKRTNVDVGYDHDLFEKAVLKRWNIYEERPMKDVGEMFQVMRKIVNSDGSRLEAVKVLMREHPKLIVFYNFDYELEELRTLAWDPSPNPFIRSGATLRSTGHLTSMSGGSSGQKETSSFAVAEWNGHKHEEIPDTDRWVYLVQYVAGAEGWNCIATDAMCFYSLTYSYKNFEQAMGRIDRMNTPFSILHYYVLLSNSLIDKAISASLKGKHNFNEAKFARLTGLKTQKREEELPAAA